MPCRKSSSQRSSANNGCRTPLWPSPRSTPRCSRPAGRPASRRSRRRRRTCRCGRSLRAVVPASSRTSAVSAKPDFNYALDPGVGVYIDDVYIPTLSSSLLELIDLDRVEILRGPQGTLAGKNAIGGAIKLFSAKPKGDDSGMLRVSYGSFNELTLRGMADLKITDSLAFRVSGMSRGSDGYVGMLDYGQTHPSSNVPQNTTRGRAAIRTTRPWAARTSWRAARRCAGRRATELEVNLSYDYTRERSEAIPTVLIAAGAIAPGGTDFNPVFRRSFELRRQPSAAWQERPAGQHELRVRAGRALQLRQRCRDVQRLRPSVRQLFELPGRHGADGARRPSNRTSRFRKPCFSGSGVQGTATYDFNDNLQLVYIGSYREYNSKFGQDQDATPIPVAQLDNELNHHAFTSEVRLNMKSANGFVEGTVGAFYLDQQGTYTARVDLNYVGPTIDFLHGPDTTPSTTKAVFGTATIHPTEALSFTGGVRYTKDEKDYTYFRSNPDSTVPNPGLCFADPPGGSLCRLSELHPVGHLRRDRQLQGQSYGLARRR